VLQLACTRVLCNSAAGGVWVQTHTCLTCDQEHAQLSTRLAPTFVMHLHLGPEWVAEYEQWLSCGQCRLWAA
jgi:hypothetical protein